MELTKKQRFWKRHLDALESFEGTTAEYARLHGLQAKKLYVYKTAIRERQATLSASGSEFVRVTTATMATLSSGITVHLPNGVRLTLPDLDQPGLLERLARL